MATGQPTASIPPHEEDGKHHPPFILFPNVDVSKPITSPTKNSVFDTFIGTHKLKIITPILSEQRSSGSGTAVDLKLSDLRNRLQVASSFYQGKPKVSFQKSDKKKLIDGLKHVLIAKCSHGRPKMADFKLYMGNQKLKGKFHVSFFDSKHVFVVCENFEDFAKIWIKQCWNINGVQIRIFKWDENFDPCKESSICPVWIHLPRLPLYLFDEGALMVIANAIGRPLFIDKENISKNKVSYASICVEMDVLSTPAQGIWIHFEDDPCAENDLGSYEGFLQEVVYNFIPSYCSTCHHLGHMSSFCKRKTESNVEQQLNTKAEQMVKLVSEVGIETSVSFFGKVDGTEKKHRGGIEKGLQQVQSMLCKEIQSPEKCVHQGDSEEEGEFKSSIDRDQWGGLTQDTLDSRSEQDKGEEGLEAAQECNSFTPANQVEMGENADGNPVENQIQISEEQVAAGEQDNHIDAAGEHLGGAAVTGSSRQPSTDTAELDDGEIENQTEAAVLVEAVLVHTDEVAAAGRGTGLPWSAGDPMETATDHVPGTGGENRPEHVLMQVEGEAESRTAGQKHDRADSDVLVDEERAAGAGQKHDSVSSFHPNNLVHKEVTSGAVQELVLHHLEMENREKSEVLLEGVLECAVGLIEAETLRIDCNPGDKLVQSDQEGKILQNLDQQYSAKGVAGGEDLELSDSFQVAPCELPEQVEGTKGRKQLDDMLFKAERNVDGYEKCPTSSKGRGQMGEYPAGISMVEQNGHTASITPQKLSSAAAEFTPKWAVLVEELVEGKKQSDPVLDEKEGEESLQGKSANAGGQVVMVTNYAMDQLNERMRRLRGEPAAPILAPISATSTWVPPSMSKHLARELKKIQHRSNQNWQDIEDYSDEESEEGELDERAGSQMLNGEAFLSDGMGDIPRPFKIKSAPNSPKGRNSSYDSSTYLLSRGFF